MNYICENLLFMQDGGEGEQQEQTIPQAQTNESAESSNTASVNESTSEVPERITIFSDIVEVKGIDKETLAIKSTPKEDKE